MCGQKTAKRRRKQSAKEYRHMAKLGRPIYKKKDSLTSARRLQKLIETERRIKQKGGK